MNALTKLKYIKELKELISQDIKNLPIKAKMGAIKRIKELIKLLKGAAKEKVETTELNKLKPVVVAIDPDGKEHRVLGLDGNPDLGTLPAGIEGIKAAPIRLQEDSFNNGHLQRHLKDLQAAGYASVEEAVIDIAKNYEQIYKGNQKDQLVLVKQVDILEEGKQKRGILLTEFQEVAGAYRIGSIFASSTDRYLKNREMLWDKSHTSRLSGSGRTRGLTGPEHLSTSNFTGNEELSKDTVKAFLQKIIDGEILPDEQSLVTMQDYLTAFNSDEEIDQLTTKALNVWLEYLLNNVAQLM